MDITKMPAPTTAAARTPAAPLAEQGPQSTASTAPIVDRADIRPLDIPTALQILLAEVRAAFDLQAIALDSNASETPDSPPQAARALLLTFISALPDESASMPAWNAVLARFETALQIGLDHGIDAISVWRDVSPVVIDAAKEARSLVFATLGDDSQNPVWLRPEWVGLEPRVERFWRRRRRVRRHLTDPDYSSESMDDDGEQRT